jgi:hypothetical protein
VSAAGIAGRAKVSCASVEILADWDEDAGVGVLVAGSSGGQVGLVASGVRYCMTPDAALKLAETLMDAAATAERAVNPAG